MTPPAAIHAAVAPVQRLGPSALRALEERLAPVRAGTTPIGRRVALSPILLPPSVTEALDGLGRATHVVLREALDAARADPRFAARLCPGPRALARVGRRFGIRQAQWAAFGVPSFFAHHRVAQPDPVPRCRLDAFWIDGSPRVFELNVGAMLCAVMDGLAQASAEPLAALVSGCAAPRAADALAEALLRRHRARFGARPARAAQLDHPGARCGDADALVEALRARGVTARRVPCGAVSFRRGRLEVDGEAITLLSEESTAEPPPLALASAAERARYKLARWRALTRGAAIVHPAPYEALFHKGFLALVSEGALRGVVDAEALDALERHVAWTRRTTPEAVASFEGDRAPLRELAIRHRARLVLKPMIGHGGRGVVLGDRTPAERWTREVDAAIRARDAVLQERLTPPSLELLLPGGRVVGAHADLSPVFVDGRLAAVFSRYDERGGLLRYLGGGGGLVPVWMAR